MEYFKPPEFGKEDSEQDAFTHEVVFQRDQPETVDVAKSFEVKDVEEKKRVKRSRKIDYSQFSTGEFNEVDSLLTNVEEYTARIREDAERYVNQVREEIDLLKSEIELELANALIKRLEAERKGEDLIRSAEDSRSEIQKAAWEEGFQTGYAEGFKKYSQANEQLTAQVTSLLKEIKNLRTHIMQEYEEQIVHLSMLIARKVVHTELTSRKEMVLDMLRDAMHQFEGMGSITIRLHPSEYDFIRAHQEELGQYLDESQLIKVKPDVNVQPASAVIDSDFSRIDLDLKKQFEEIDQRLRECAEDRRILFRPE